MKGHTIGYVRVSTFEQNTDRQLEGIELHKVFTDKASENDAKRPELGALMQFVREGDTVVVHSMDRLARNQTISDKLFRSLPVVAPEFSLLKKASLLPEMAHQWPL